MSSGKTLSNKQTGEDNEEIDLVTLEKTLNSIDITRKTSHTSTSDDGDKKCNLLETITRTVGVRLNKQNSLFHFFKISLSLWYQLHQKSKKLQ